MVADEQKVLLVALRTQILMTELVWGVNGWDGIFAHLAREKKFKTLAVSRPNWQKGALGVLGARWQQNPVGRAVENGPTEKVS